MLEVIKESLNYTDLDMKKLKSAIGRIVVDDKEQFDDLVNSIISGKKINYTKETKSLKNIISSFQEYMSDDEVYDIVMDVAYDINLF